MDAAELGRIDILGDLSADQLAELVEAGEEIEFEPGVELFTEGDHADYWWILLEGSIELVRHVQREDKVVGQMDVPGRWAGGFRAWDDAGVYLATGRSVRRGRAYRLDAGVLRQQIDAWFPLGGHLVQGLYHTARSIESTARQHGALVTLGTLSAGLAHELNNPASASVRAVDSLDQACQTLLTSLSRLAADHISADQFRAIDRLRREIDPSTADRDPLARADREQDLSLWLSRRGIDRGWAIAPALADAGVEVDWCDRAAEALGDRALEAGLEWVASTLAAGALLKEMKESTRRVSEIVEAIRSYSQVDRGSMQRTDVTEGLESTLVMLGHKLGTGVRVVRGYDDVPLVDAFPGELNQVWTNVIDNAIDAMEADGTLRISVTAADGFLVVEIGDTGPGLPPTVADRVFEAFFTTKDVGKGTGLGLDIARRIVVTRHGGDIAFERRGDETVVVVTLPLRSTSGAD